MIRKTGFLVFAVVLSAVPARSQSAMDQLRLQVGGAAFSPVPSASGVLAEYFVLSFAPRFLKNVVLAAAPAVSVELPPLLNRQWTRSDSFGGGPDRQYLSIGFDRGGNAYVGAAGEGWAHPWFYRLQRGMNGRWQANSRIYRLSLDVSIFRSRLANRIQVSDESGGKRAYDRTISSLLLATYYAGKTVTVGGRSYKLFYGNSLKTDTSPAGTEWGTFDLVFVYDKNDDSDDQYQVFQFRRESLVGAAPARVELNGKVVGLRITPDFSTLELYDSL